MDCYHELHRRGLTPSLRHFSEHWLACAPNYACSRKGRELSAAARVELCKRLWRQRHYVLALRVMTSLFRENEAADQAEPGR